jgi:hypothetical protein
VGDARRQRAYDRPPHHPTASGVSTVAFNLATLRTGAARFPSLYP